MNKKAPRRGRVRGNGLERKDESGIVFFGGKQQASNISNRSQVQGSTFSAASGHRSGRFDQKSDAGLAESHTRVSR